MTRFLVRLFVKNSENISDPAVRKGYGALSGGVGIACNLLLCIVKITAGLLTASISVTADGFNNLSDMGSSVITLIGFKLAGRPADRDHPFGHGRMEYMAALTVSMLILLVGVELFKSSLSSLIKGKAVPDYSVASLIILAASVFVKLWMYIFNRRLYKKVGSGVFKATALDSLNDILSTCIILIAAVISLVIELPFNLDAVMGIFLSAFIFCSGFSTGRGTVDLLLGTPPDKQLTEDIKNTVLSFDGFIGIHDLIIHNYGPGRQFASLHVEVPQNTDFAKCHEQVDLCEKLVDEKYNITLVIHMDPIDTNDETVGRVRGELSAAIGKINGGMTLHDFRMTPAGDCRTNLIFDVVVPSDCKKNIDELRSEISALAAEIDPTYCCVITFDNDFTGA